MSQHTDFTDDFIPVGQLGPEDIVYIGSPIYGDNSKHREDILNGTYDLWESAYQHPLIKARRAEINEHGLERVKLKCPKRHPLMVIRMTGSSMDHVSPFVAFEVDEKLAGEVIDSRQSAEEQRNGDLNDLERVTFHCSVCRERNPNANVTLTLQRLLAVYLAAILQGKKWAILQ